jgi:hypothetical protein
VVDTKISGMGEAANLVSVYFTGIQGGVNVRIPVALLDAAIAAAIAGEAVLYLDVADQVVTGGVRVTSLDLGTPAAASTVTLDPGDRPLQHLTNNAAFTLAPGANSGSMILDITNGASAGAITTSGWTKVVGAFATTNGYKYRCSCSVGNGGSLLTIQALQ